MKCTKCGKSLPDDALFCNSCGERVETSCIKENFVNQEQELNVQKELQSENQPEVKRQTDNDVLEQKNSLEVPSSKNDMLPEVSKKKDRTWIWILLILCAIGLGIKGYTAYLNKQNEAILNNYIQGKYGTGFGNNKSVDYSSDTNDQVRQEMEDAAMEYDKELPENIGYGMTMVKCSVEGKSMVYTIQWEGMSPSDFTSDAISELKLSYLEGIKEEGIDPMIKALTNRMSKYGYDFIYRFVNEKGEELCSINISPSEFE